MQKYGIKKINKVLINIQFGNFNKIKSLIEKTLLLKKLIIDICNLANAA